MSLKEKSPKDTYIKLMLANYSDGKATTIGESYKEVDITDAVLAELPDFGGNCILGVRYENENSGQSWTPLFYTYPLYEKIEWEAERIFDACIVNEKQKKAVKELFRSRLTEAFDSESRTLDFAISIVKSKEKV